MKAFKLPEEVKKAFGDAVHEGLLDLLGELVRHGGGDVARGDAVDGDPPGCDFPRQGPGKAHDTRLGGGVVGLAGVADEADDGGDVDDPAAAAGNHGFDDCFGEIPAAFEVDADDGVPLLFLHPEEEVVAGDAGVVNEVVDPPTVPEDGIDDAGRILQA